MLLRDSEKAVLSATIDGRERERSYLVKIFNKNYGRKGVYEYSLLTQVWERLSLSLSPEDKEDDGSLSLSPTRFVMEPLSLHALSLSSCVFVASLYDNITLQEVPMKISLSSQ